MNTLSFRILLFAVITIGAGLLTACSSTWDDAQEADTYESYENYISDNPEGEHVETAWQRADSLYWQSIKDDTTTTAFQNYLDKFPEGQYRAEAQAQLRQPAATRARVTGSNVIIRSDHTTESPSAGVVAREGTEVDVLERYLTSGSSEALLKNNIVVIHNGNRLQVSSGKALRIIEDRDDSVRVSLSTREAGRVETTISKMDVEAMGDQQWYKVRTRDGITGWIYGKFIEEL